MRPLNKVIEAILRVAPPEHDIVSALKSNLTSTLYAAPEMMGFWWEQVAANLNRHLTSPLHPPKEWEKKVGDIFADRIDYKTVLEEDTTK